MLKILAVHLLSNWPAPRFPFAGRLFLITIFFCQVITVSVFAQSNVSPQGGQYLQNLYDKTIIFDTTLVVVEEPSGDLADTLDAWKQWRTVDNFFFGKNRGALPMIADLESLHPYFKDKVLELIRICKAAGINLAVVETYRTHAKQSEYFGMGKKYTGTAGGGSKHQYGLAVDVVPMIDSTPVWNNTRLWKKIGVIGERLGLRWGGRWRVPYDPAHFEWSGGVSSHQLAKGSLPRIPHSKAHHYPCLEEDLRLLKMYWEAWEVEQSVFAKNPVLDMDQAMKE